jgi:hypothetical protein
VRSVTDERSNSDRVPVDLGAVGGVGAGSSPTGPNREPRTAAPLSFPPRIRQSVETAFLCIGHAPSASCGQVQARLAAPAERTQGVAHASIGGAIWQTSQTPTMGPRARRRRVTTHST